MRHFSDEGTFGLAVSALTLIFISICVLMTPPPSAAMVMNSFPPPYKKCGKFKAGTIKIHVYAKRMKCKKAKRIQKTFWNPKSKRIVVNGGSGWKGWTTLKRFPGWRCTTAAGSGACVRGKRQAAYAVEL